MKYKKETFLRQFEGKNIIPQKWDIPEEYFSSKIFDASGKKIAILKYAQDIEKRIVDIWDLEGQPKLLNSLTLQTQSDIKTAVCFSEPDCIACGDYSGTLFIANWGNKIIKEVNMHDMIRKIWYDPQEKLYWIFTNGSLYIYPHIIENPLVESIYQRIYPLQILINYPIRAMDISEDFSLIAFLLQSGEIWLWKVPSGHSAPFQQH